MKASNASVAHCGGTALPCQTTKSIGVNLQLMRIFVALATIAYLAVMFAFVGAVGGFFVGFVGVLMFDVDFAHLPLFGTGGAVGLALWAFSRICRSDARATQVVEATPRDDNWMAENLVEHSPMAFDQAQGLFDDENFVERSSTQDHFDQPRLLIDAFTFGDNLYESIYET